MEFDILINLSSNEFVTLSVFITVAIIGYKVWKGITK